MSLLRIFEVRPDTHAPHAASLGNRWERRQPSLERPAAQADLIDSTPVGVLWIRGLDPALSLRTSEHIPRVPRTFVCSRLQSSAQGVLQPERAAPCSSPGLSRANSLSARQLPDPATPALPLRRLSVMLTVLGLCVLALIWAGVLIAIWSICAAGGAADDQAEEWYSRQERSAEAATHQERGAA
jgi:hypothetical protein